ncbi:MAG: transcriptional regulator [Oscillospiraceae bacterium]|nr:transcriptional regulator [Oscillospiraceae bacterium]
MAGGIAHQNKDIIFKILSENYKNKTLAVYGLDLPRIKEALPTNLPALQVDERRSDNIFLLEDDSILIQEYESSGDAKNLVKYGHYAFRVAEANQSGGKLRKVTIAVIYTGDILSAADRLDIGCMQLNVRQVFLSGYDGGSIYAELERKVRGGEALTDEDVMRFIILPLTARKDKQELIESAVSLAKEVGDEVKQSFIVAGILAATDKFIDQNYSNKMKEWLKMTQVGRLFEEEKLEYAEEKLNERNREMAKEMLLDGEPLSKIMKYTKWTKEEIQEIEKSLQ